MLFLSKGPFSVPSDGKSWRKVRWRNSSIIRVEKRQKISTHFFGCDLKPPWQWVTLMTHQDRGAATLANFKIHSSSYAFGQLQDSNRPAISHVSAIICYCSTEAKEKGSAPRARAKWPPSLNLLVPALWILDHIRIKSMKSSHASPRYWYFHK